MTENVTCDMFIYVLWWSNVFTFMSVYISVSGHYVVSVDVFVFWPSGAAVHSSFDSKSDFKEM